jgi:acetyl esterase/lipase
VTFVHREGGEYSDVWYQVHTRKENADSCGLVYYHGGGAVFGSAKEFNYIVNRYVIETGCTIFNVDYGLAPEHNLAQGNSGMHDAYDAAISISDQIINEGAWGLNPERLAYFGESGGGYIAGAVGVLMAENNESHRW